MSYDEQLLESAEELLGLRGARSALELFELAEMTGGPPDRCSAGRWMASMLLGNFTAAWRESDAIRARGAPDPHRFWRGEEIRGESVIVRCLHGLGDTVQFVRYAPQLAAMARSVIWELPPALLESAPYFDGVNCAITWGHETASLRWDVQVEVMELPYLFRTKIEDLPIATNYLRLPDALVRAVAAEMPATDLPRVGVVWAAGEWNQSRSLPLALARRLVERSGCEFWNLQGGPERWGLQANLRDLPACNDGVLALAAVISQMDLILTVDTLAAHLAGALGVPAWLMLQHAADWRWMIERDDSPWYPSLRLFRQQAAGDWLSVLSSIEDALDTWLKSFDRTRLAA